MSKPIKGFSQDGEEYIDPKIVEDNWKEWEEEQADRKSNRRVHVVKLPNINPGKVI